MATKTVKKETNTNAVPGARPDYLPKETYDIPVDMVAAIKIIQSLSPERMKSDPAFIPGAEEGMLFNSETKELYGGEKGFVVVPLQMRKSYVEWIPRAQGGGFVASYGTKEEMESGYSPGNDIQISIEVLCYIPGADKTAVIRFDTSSKLGIARKWASAIKGAETMYGANYLVKTVLKKNRAGQPYYNFDISFRSWIESAEQFKKLASLADQSKLPMLTGSPVGNAKESM